MNYPAEIEQTATRIAELVKEIGDIRTDLRDIETEQVVEVLTAKDESGKALFTNDKQRDTALATRLMEHPRHCKLKADLSEGELEKAIAGAKLERLRGEFKLHLLDRQEQIAQTNWQTATSHD